MSQSVKVKVRPGRTLQFPGICVHCSRPAGERLPLRKRRGRLTRFIDVPLCQRCARQVARKSGEEERLDRLGRFVAVVAGLLVLIAAFFLSPGGMPVILRLIIALVASLSIGGAVLFLFKRRSLAAAHEEKLAILESARMVEFSWRATTFQFQNDEFAAAFTALNESRLMNNSNGDLT